VLPVGFACSGAGWCSVVFAVGLVIVAEDNSPILVGLQSYTLESVRLVIVHGWGEPLGHSLGFVFLRLSETVRWFRARIRS